MRRRGTSDTKGFTLIEMAFVLVIVGILISMGVELLPMLVKQKKYADTRSAVAQARTALIGYARANGRLPRASSSTNGLETANTYRGYLPYATIGLGSNGRDPYTRTLFYAVHQDLTTTTSANFYSTLVTISSSPPNNRTLYADGAAGTGYRAAFLVLSSGADLRVNAPNDDNKNGIVNNGDDRSFAQPGSPETATYDDYLEAVDINQMIGLLPLP
ncbi:MAG TPA: prepilin-type N-terminal cleavage/methylation domain-containing protein [Deltaproteobacteria bacterium]|nr:prepilin-type N-terminal cleavage/methylation domain-containing protein [Deltaproteobacteria bacterium]HOI05808.1 prepilin-type N-terminal cleavage/methylation domain-containing protein [Deltaproteobacteria bacterium]